MVAEKDCGSVVQPWTVKDCDRCGCTYQFTRSDPKPAPDEYVCHECAAYERGYNEGVKHTESGSHAQLAQRIEDAGNGFWNSHQAQLKSLADEVRALECRSVAGQKYLDALAEIEAWKDASGLINGHGDPDGITPDIARRYWEGVERERDQLRATEQESVYFVAEVEQDFFLRPGIRGVPMRAGMDACEAIRDAKDASGRLLISVRPMEEKFVGRGESRGPVTAAPTFSDDSGMMGDVE